MAMTLHVYKVTATGERHEVLPLLSVTGEQAARLGCTFPPCECPGCLALPEAERAGNRPETPPLA